MPIALDVPAAETAILASANSFRQKHNLSALKPNAQLAAAARAYAKALAARAALSHTLGGTTPASRAKAAGYAYCEIAENLAALYDSSGFTTADYAQRALAGWEGSPGHRENLLRANVTETGVGVASAGPNDPRYVAVQLFGRPLSLKYSFKIKNAAAQAVSYAFAGEPHVVKPRYVITHGACAPGTLTFATGGEPARFEARDGELYTLKPDGSGGVRVEVGKSSVSP